MSSVMAGLSHIEAITKIVFPVVERAFRAREERRKIQLRARTVRM